jgi:hypothetical protein
MRGKDKEDREWGWQGMLSAEQRMIVMGKVADGVG